MRGKGERRENVREGWGREREREGREEGRGRELCDKIREWQVLKRYIGECTRES